MVRFSEDLKNLRRLEIPRRIFIDSTIVELQLHDFSDASLAAYKFATF